MVSQVKISVTGAKEIEAAMKELGSRAANRIARSALTRAGTPIVKRAKELVPVRTGELRKAIAQLVMCSPCSPAPGRVRSAARNLMRARAELKAQSHTTLVGRDQQMLRIEDWHVRIEQGRCEFAYVASYVKNQKAAFRRGQIP